MTGAWRGGLQVTQAVNIGAQTSSSLGVAIAGGSSTFTKGAWTQLIASTNTDTSWIVVYLQEQTSGGTTYAVDIGTGTPGNEQVVIPNIACNMLSGYWYSLPFQIPSGTRLAARGAGNSGSDTFTIGITLFSDTMGNAGAGSIVDTYGFNTSSNFGTAVDAGGTANTKGAYSQITSSLSADISGLILLIDYQGITTASEATITWLFDLAVGSPGSEVVILPNIFIAGDSFGGVIWAPLVPYIPIQIAAGTRIAVRASCSVNITPDRIFGITMYGVRQ